MAKVSPKLRKTGGGKLSRSEVITVRLDPKLRYMAELAARMQRRTLSSFIEWAIERTLSAINSSPNSELNTQTLWEEADNLWDVDEADRLANLALRHPEWLTHDEQILWKLIRENGYLWKGRYDRNEEWVWSVEESDLIKDRLRDHWSTFNAAAQGDAEALEDLPTWTKKRAPSKKTASFDDLDDDVPF